jgi:hypothetical protein
MALFRFGLNPGTGIPPIMGFPSPNLAIPLIFVVVVPNYFSISVNQTVFAWFLI